LDLVSCLVKTIRYPAVSRFSQLIESLQFYWKITDYFSNWKAYCSDNSSNISNITESSEEISTTLGQAKRGFGSEIEQDNKQKTFGDTIDIGQNKKNKSNWIWQEEKYRDNYLALNIDDKSDQHIGSGTGWQKSDPIPPYSTSGASKLLSKQQETSKNNKSIAFGYEPSTSTIDFSNLSGISTPHNSSKKYPSSKSTASSKSENEQETRRFISTTPAPPNTNNPYAGVGNPNGDDKDGSDSSDDDDDRKLFGKLSLYHYKPKKKNPLKDIKTVEDAMLPVLKEMYKFFAKEVELRETRLVSLKKEIRTLLNGWKHLNKHVLLIEFQKTDKLPW
jgi:hypothetical protein